MADTDGSDEARATRAAEPTDADQKAAEAAAANRAAYEERRTGDPIGDADLREQMGVPSTPEEESALLEQQVDLMTSPNIVARERFDQSAKEGARAPGEEEQYAKFQADLEAATVQRDEQAFIDARAALGEKTTPEDLRKFDHPTITDLYTAERQAALTGIEVPDDSPLALQHAALQDEMNKAYIDRDPRAFEHAREMQGQTTTPEDIAAFENPSPSDVLGMGRNAALLGIEVPDGSALAQQMSNVMDGKAPGNVTPTQTQGQGQGTAAAPGTGTQQSGNSSTGDGASTTAADRMAFAGGAGGDHAGPSGGGGASTQSATSPGGGSDVPLGAPSGGSTPSPLDAAVANLSAGSTDGPDIPTSRGTDSAGSTTGLGLPGGVGTQNNGIPAGGNSSAGTAGGAPDPLDDSGVGMTSVGGQETDADGAVTTDLPGGGTSTTYPDGTTAYHDKDGNLTGTMTGADYEATKQGSDSASADTGDASSDDSDSSDDDDSDSDDDDSDDDDSDDDGDDSGSSTAMTNPDDATTLTGLAASVGGDPLGLTSISTYGSSTHGGATDGGRGDLGGGLGEITGEAREGGGKAGPETNPDEAPVDTDRLVDQYHKGDGIGATDGVRPDLADAGLGPIQPPDDNGVDPYAQTLGTVSDGVTGTPHGGGSAVNLGDGQELEAGEVQVDTSAAQLDLNLDDGLALTPGGDEHGDIGLGGAGDDHFH